MSSDAQLEAVVLTTIILQLTQMLYISGILMEAIPSSEEL